MNRVLRIGGALVLGVLVVTSAYYVSQKNKPSPSAEIVVSTPSSNLSQSSFGEKDSDGDGVPDWREDYDNNVFDVVETPSPLLAVDKGEAEKYVPPTSFTGKFGVAFLQDYMSGAINGSDFTDSSAFVGSAVDSINANSGSNHYTRLNFTLVEGDFDSLRSYGNNLGFILQLDIVKTVQDALILREALAAKDKTKLKKLQPIENTIENTIILLLGIQVPAQMAEQHLELLNTYESMKTTVAAMQLAFDDPLYTLARMRNYTTDIEHLADTVKTITQKLTAEGIVYSHEEPGAQLYLSDI